MRVTGFGYYVFVTVELWKFNFNGNVQNTGHLLKYSWHTFCIEDCPHQVMNDSSTAKFVT